MVLLYISPTAHSEELPDGSREATWRESATDVIWGDCLRHPDGCGTRTPQDIANDLVTAILHYEQLPINGGPGQGEHIGRVYVRLASQLLQANVGWDARYLGLDYPPGYISWCESHNDYGAVNPNGHYGKWQFSVSTWRSVGGSGYPHHATSFEQDFRAAILYDNGSGASHWECY